MILDSLRYWVREMHVDGFRFDLASILSRDTPGQPMANPPVLWDIDTDPVLAGTKIIAEAWDAAGLYQVGSFIGSRWKRLGRGGGRSRSAFWNSVVNNCLWSLTKSRLSDQPSGRRVLPDNSNHIRSATGFLVSDFRSEI